ncbi:programmed cell death 1 ligand 2 isoform X1 [Ornithorhynchus anatinus]|uniref:programmed cell death 1 ligand 2 isoform X1 n=1 Tax=Ornithorhynchus anatinus TaxID=9258 RepID=UPI0010A7A0C5|nr:programmed cell death 1 ligand 2 isoform X1 [Ornithorhynchus anatinus]XP_028912159.1 programmed cell death 1 ligand 2 isoform X1 [Ornithorhynchus anatinus]XP_028912162.1 programmed cell death 1 ligand 2 isoform X1 [Ornithorhynchus anatinus]
MCLFLLVLILEMQLHLMPALFTVQIPKDFYTVDYGSNVTMECNFNVENQMDFNILLVFWDKDEKNIVKFAKGQEDLKTQDEHYRGRATLLREELSSGKALLRISDVKITDAGQYRCLISYGGADYKYITLKVKASYKPVNTQILAAPGGDEEDLICQAKGFPLAEVSWQNVSAPANTSYTRTPDGLYHITSVLRLPANSNKNVSCIFWNKDVNERTTANLDTPAPTEVPLAEKTSLFYLFIPTCIIAFIFISALIFLRRPLCRELSNRKENRTRGNGLKLQQEKVRHKEDRGKNFFECLNL